MVKDIAYYKSIQNAKGTTSKKEYEVSKLKGDIAKHFEDSIDFEKDTKVDGIDQSLIVIKTKDDYVKTIIARPNENLEVGQVVDCYDCKYLIMTVDSKEIIYSQGTMEQTNHTLLFQNPQGTILSYPCIDSNSTGNESENKIITVGNITKTITIPYDESTILLSNGKRFFIDRNIVNPKAYEIIGVDSTSKSYGDKGLIILTVRECVGEEDDRIDLGVCNYVEVVEEPVVTVGNTYSTILCNNPDNELIVGSTIYRTLTPTFYNSDKTIDTGIIPVWEFIYPIGFESDFTVVYDGNQAKIKVKENYDLLGLVVLVNIMSSNGGYGGSTELKIMI